MTTRIVRKQGNTVLEIDSDNQDCQAEGDKENWPRSTELKTKLAIALERCLGPSTYIQQLDNLRYKIKHDNKTSKMLKSKHRELILSLKEELLTQKQELKMKIKTYEHSF